MIKSLYQEIKNELLCAADKKVAQDSARYHKYDGYRSYGVKTSVRDRILKSYKRRISALSCKDSVALALLFYRDRVEETVLAGNFILQTNIDSLGVDHLAFLDRALNYFNSWSTIDDFCIDVLQPLLNRYPQEVLKLISNWNRSKNMWKRRASVVAFTRKCGESGKFTKPALALCENLLKDKEDLVRKGVGWCLKDVLRGDQEKVLQYVKDLRKRGVSSTITLYAIRDLKGAQRAEVLAIKN
ncbi:MAG: DNA alkylation repair protein [Bdellovibrionota bacterium]